MAFSLSGRVPRDAASARLIGGALVISLADADPAAVWRLPLADQGTAAFALREEGGFWLLEMTPTSESANAVTLARYRSHDQARAALDAVASALLRPASGAMQQTPSPSEVWARSYARQPWVWATVVLTLLLVMMLLTRFAPVPTFPGPEAGLEGAVERQGAAAPGAVPGAPQNADDFFRNR